MPTTQVNMPNPDGWADKQALLEAIRQGVPVSLIGTVQRRMGITQQRIAGLLNITARTLQRYAPTNRLNPPLSEKVAYLEHLQNLGRQVFGTDAQFAQWLQEELPALNNAKPIAYLDTITGIQAVRETLLRYQHGIY